MLNSEQLLASPLVRNVLSPEELRLAETDDDWLPNEVMEQWKSVFVLTWDSSMPGSCGASFIEEWRGIYFFASTDLESMGPFACLEEALDVEYLQSFFYYFSIDSDVIPQDKLVALVSKRFEEQEGDTIQINDTTYTLTNAGLVPQVNEAGGQP
jgi:hypothetical protein